MLSLDDPIWSRLNGGYRLPYNPAAALSKLRIDFRDDAAWQELWQDLCHQGDVGEASYATIPHLVALAVSAPVRDWNLYGLAAAIETERHRQANPRLPSELEADYREAWTVLRRLALQDLGASLAPLLVRSAIGVVAHATGQTKLAAMIDQLDESELDAYLEEHLDWSTLYRADPDAPTAV